MLPHLRELCGNPSSSHVFGRRAPRRVDDARGQVAHYWDVQSMKSYSHPGARKRNNLALRGVTEAVAQATASGDVDH